MIKRKLSIELIILLVLFAAVTVNVIIDSLYHFGYFHKPVFLEHNIPPYHWRINYPSILNYEKSSIRYLNDIQEIDRLTVPGSVFYSDVATSYYVAVSSALYAANPKSNHRTAFNRKHATAPGSLLHNLCNGGKYAGKYDTLTDYFNAKNTLNVINGFSPIDYFIYNKDQVNSNVINCRKDQYAALSSTLEEKFKILFNGDYLDLYQITEQ
jgi:hypothetical protein